MTSKEEIINNIKKANLSDTGLPEYDFKTKVIQNWEPLFVASAKKSASKFIRKEDVEKPETGKFINLSESIILQSDDLQGVESPYELVDITLLILDGAIGVAENGAIWVESKKWPFRVLPFIAEHLIICLKREHLVGNMHDAYAKIGTSKYDFGVFIAGPSKTADIEQSLVVGAQGPKSLGIVLV